MSEQISKSKKWKKSLYILPILLVLAIIVVPIIDKNYGSSIRPELKDFAVEDPEEIDKIFMANKRSDSSFVILEKNDRGKWMVNGKYPAEEEYIKLLINDYMARLEVKNPIPKAGIEGVMRSMAANATKVEIYKDKRLYKVYYVGGNTADELATHMFMEGSQVPFAVHIPGFNGYPGEIYRVEEKRWVSRNLFQTSILELQSLELRYPQHPDSSFKIEKADRNLKITPLGSQAPMDESKLNVNLLKQYAATFESLSFEDYFSGLAKVLADSVVSNGTPFLKVKLTRMDGGVHTLDVYQKPVTKESPKIDSYGNPTDYDINRFYGILDGNKKEVLSIQSFVFKNVLYSYNDFFQ